MKLTKIICVILAITFALSALQIAAFAADDGKKAYCAHCVGEAEVIICDDVSPETAAKIKAHFSGIGSEQQAAKGILCTLFGHNLDTGVAKTITHKVRATSPRCLEETYEYQVCTRCDFSDSILIGSRYIVCC